MRELSREEIALRRLAANGLSRPFGESLESVQALAGIQSQFQQWAEVSIMNRCAARLRMADLAECYQQHKIINIWGQRNTLHMYVTEDWPLISDLYEPRLASRDSAPSRYPEDFAWLMEQIEAECGKKQSIAKGWVLDLVGERMRGRHSQKDYFGYFFIVMCCLRGVFFGLPEKPGIKSFVGRDGSGLPPWQADAERAARALEDFMLRYFRYYGPATLADFCHWSGLPQSAVKGCLNGLRESLAQYTHNGREYFALEQAPDQTLGQIPGQTPGQMHGQAPKQEHDQPGEGLPGGIFLLGKFDPLFVSYRHKDWIIPSQQEKQVWRSAGWVEGVVLDGAEALGTWRHSLKGRKMSVEVSQFKKIKAASRKKIQARAERLAEFWDKQLDVVQFV